jgi:hypothetical protein
MSTPLRHPSILIKLDAGTLVQLLLAAGSLQLFLNAWLVWFLASKSYAAICRMCKSMIKVRQRQGAGARSNSRTIYTEYRNRAFWVRFADVALSDKQPIRSDYIEYSTADHKQKETTRRTILVAAFFTLAQQTLLLGKCWLFSPVSNGSTDIRTHLTTSVLRPTGIAELLPWWYRLGLSLPSTT